MKMVMAIFRPDKCEEVKEALKEVGITGMTFTHVTGRGQQAGVRFTSRVGDFVVDEIEKVKVEIVLEDDSSVDLAVDTVRRAAWTGHPGDGRVFVIPVEASYRISDYREETQNH